MIKEIDGSFQDKNSELLNDIYLPAKNKADIENSKPFKILKENKQDVTELFTGQKNEMLEPITMKKYQEKDKESNAKFYLNSIKEIGNNLFDFVDQSFAGDIYNLTASGMKMSTTLNPDKIKEEMEGNQIPPTFGILANNIGEFGVNLLPVMDKLIDFMGKPPGPDGKIPDVFNNDEKLMEWSGEKVKYFKDNRAKFKAIQDDANMASQFANLVVQDSMVSIPLYEGLTKAGVPKIWATVLGFGMGSAIALEDKLFGAESTFIQEFGKEEVNAFKKILSIIPDTPIDAIADEVIQTFEYTAFAFAIGPIIQAAKFMKTNLPSFAVGGAVAGAIEGGDPNTEEPTQEFNLGIDQGKKKSEINLDDQSTLPGTVNQYGFEKTASLKALVNAVIPKKAPVFNSAVKQAVENIAEKGTGDQILGTIKNVPGVKANEIKWIGLDTFLEGKKSVTKKEVVDFVNANSLDVSEVTLPRVSEDGDNFNQLLNKVKTEKNNLVKEIQDLPENNNILIDSYSYQLTNTLENGSRVKEIVSIDTLDNVFIGQRLNTYIAPPVLQTRSGKVFNKQGLIDDFAKEGDPNTLEFYMFEDSVSGRMTAVRKIDVEDYTNKPDPFSGGKYEFSYKTEMNMKEAEKYMLQKSEDKINRALKAVSGDTKFKDSNYTEPGGEDYKEIIFKLKGDGNYPIEKLRYGTGLGNKAITRKEKTEFPYRSPAVHFGTKNEFAHVRFKTRMKGNMKLLAVEEMQADIVQDMARNFGERVTDFPFKNNWYELVSKRLIRYAADNGFDAVAIPKGQTIATRYKQKIDNIKEVNLEPRIGPSGNDLRFVVTYFGGGNRELKRQTLYNDEIFQLQKELGPKNYLKIKDQIDEAIKNIKSKEDIKKDLIIGKFDKPVTIGSGKGKADLYDKAIPSFLKKYSKKWNAKVYDDSIKVDPTVPMDSIGYAKDKFGTNIPFTIIEITPSMKKSVQEEGQSLFEILGIGGAGAVGAKAVSDSQGNNTISNLTQ
jgi:hypothetical protein